MRWPVKSLALLAYLASDAPAILARAGSIGLTPSLAGFALLFVLLAGTLFLAAGITNSPLRVATALLLGLASGFQQCVERVTGGPLTYEAFVNLMAARDNLGAALSQHGAVLLIVGPVTLLLVAGIALPPARPPRFWSRREQLVAKGAVPLAIALLALLLYQRGGEGSRALPASFAPIAFTALLGVDALANPPRAREPVKLPRSGDRPARDILLIVDESIAANYLDINHPAGVPTGLGRPRPGIIIRNYGYAASVHNCSATSNLVLRYGGTRETYQQAIASGPSLWAHARHAGYETVFIDAQTGNGALQNRMETSERAEIDHHIQFGNIAPMQRDMAAADELVRRIGNATPEFIYVNKVGAHFPIQDKYPDRLMLYRPVLERGHAPAVTWSSNRAGFDGSPDAWVRYRNSYRNTLLWTVGAFFDRLLDKAQMGKATILYTSDHGQDLHERGNPGRNTHCGTTHPLDQEGLVPLLVIEGDGARTLDWDRTLRRNRNGMSHFRIHPTLLALMGYDESAFRPFYGPTLADPAPDPFTFNTRFWTRLGQKPEWEHIELRDVNAPPVSDYRP